jgi:hypothetical protein
VPPVGTILDCALPPLSCPQALPLLISTLLRRGKPTDVLALVVVDLGGVPYTYPWCTSLSLVLVYVCT